MLTLSISLPVGEQTDVWRTNPTGPRSTMSEIARGALTSESPFRLWLAGHLGCQPCSKQFGLLGGFQQESLKSPHTREHALPSRSLRRCARC